jgi:hypothetical protein
MAQDIKRVNYFEHQFLHESDFNDEQRYHLQLQRDHARLQHTPGIAEGLEVPDQGGISPNFTGLNTTRVSVSEGIAYDALGRRIVLAESLQIDLASKLSGKNEIYLAVAYGGDDKPSTDPQDQATVSGVTTATRWVEKASIDVFETKPDQSQTLVLAKITRDGSALITQIDRSERLRAGVQGGDLVVQSLILQSQSFPTGSVTTRLGANRRADIDGSLFLLGDLIVKGTIEGDIAVGSVKRSDFADDAVGSAALAEADGSSGQNTSSGSGVKTNHIQDGAVTNAKIGTDVGNRIANVESHAANTNNPHGTTAAQIDAAGGANRIVTQINAGSGTINAARIDTAIARVNQVTASAVDAAGGTNQIVNQINSGSGAINAARIDTAIARVSQVTALTVDAAGGTNQIVNQINNGTGTINALRLPISEKLNGKYLHTTLNVPAAGISHLITARDMRNKMISMRGWASSLSDATPNNIAAATLVKNWPQPGAAPSAAQENWVFCKSAAALPVTTGTLYSVTEAANNVTFALEFTLSALNLRITGTAGFTVQYVFLFTWEE